MVNDQKISSCFSVLFFKKTAPPVSEKLKSRNRQESSKQIDITLFFSFSVFTVRTVSMKYPTDFF